MFGEMHLTPEVTVLDYSHYNKITLSHHDLCQEFIKMLFLETDFF